MKTKECKALETLIDCVDAKLTEVNRALEYPGTLTLSDIKLSSLREERARLRVAYEVLGKLWTGFTYDSQLDEKVSRLKASIENNRLGIW